MAAPTDTIRFEVDPRLDPRQLNALYRVRRRLHVPGLLPMDAARALYRHLAEQTQWSLVLREGGLVREATPEMRRNFPPERERELAALAYAGAREGFEFLYEYRRVADDAVERAADPTLLARFVDFLNSPPFLDFVRRLTGVADIVRADAQATRYLPGHFLTKHDDLAAPGQKRRVAYVVNLTPEWEADWGGQLQFIDSDGHVAEAYVPRFNALNVFSVPQLHAVSFVAPFARVARYSITGWLRAR